MKFSEEVKYLSFAGEMEADLLSMNRALEQLNQQISTLGRPRPVPVPVLLEPDPFHGLWGFLGMEALLLFFLLLLCWLSVLWFDLPYAFVQLAAFLAVLSVSVGVGRRLWKHSSRIRCYNREQMDTYKAYEKEEFERLRLEETMASLLRQSRGALQAQRDQTQKALGQYYAFGVLHPKYQNLAAVLTLRAYLESGECGSLSVACERYELDIRKNRVTPDAEELMRHAGGFRPVQQNVVNAIQNSERLARLLCENAASSQAGPENNEFSCGRFYGQTRLRDELAVSWVREQAGIHKTQAYGAARP